MEQCAPSRGEEWVRGLGISAAFINECLNKTNRRLSSQISNQQKRKRKAYIPAFITDVLAVHLLILPKP